MQAALAAPAGLAYHDATPVYTVGEAIVANAPTSTGGPIAEYRVEPALPAGLVLNPSTGVISGTPTAAATTAQYRIDGSNAAGTTSATLTITVQPAVAPPTSLSYAMPTAVCFAGGTIAPNVPTVTGGPASSFAVSPQLPEGLSLNAATGAITGTPTTDQPATEYTITASNQAGTTQTVVSIRIVPHGSFVSRSTQPAPIVLSKLTLLADGSVLAVGGSDPQSNEGGVALCPGDRHLDGTERHEHRTQISHRDAARTRRPADWRGHRPDR